MSAPAVVQGARGWALEIRPGNRAGIVTLALLYAGERIQDAVALDAHGAGELARALAAALHAAGGRQ
jgi:hypothetical protein